MIDSDSDDERVQQASALAGAMLSNDNRAQASRAVELVVGLTVAGIVAAFLIPVAITEIVSVETTNWGSGASSLWEIMDLIIVLAVFLFMIGLALKRSNM